MIHLKCKGRYGYEYIMKEVAKKFKTKLHVNEWRLKFSSKLPYMLEHFTTTSHHTQIHCCYYGRLSTSSAKALPCGMHFIDGRPCKVLTIVPSSLIFIQNGEIPKEGKIWNAKQHIWRVFHSMHASYNEMRILLRYLKPQNIYPFVPPADCQDVIVAYNRLQDLQCKENETMDDSTQTNLERSLPIEENTTWKQGLERAKPVKITSPPQMKNTSPLFSPPPARRKKKRSSASNLNHTNERMVTSSKRLSLDESRSSKKITSLEDSACDQVASLKTSSTVVVTRSENLDDRQSFSPSKGLEENPTKTGKVNSPFKQREEDVSSLSKSPIHRIERAGPSPKRKDKEEPGIVFVEEGRQIVEETQDLVVPKSTNQQKTLTKAEKRYYAPHEAQPMNVRNQVENKSKKNDFKTVPITFVENALEENQDKSHILENPFCTIIERTSQIIEEDSQCGENESKAKTNTVESVLRSSQIEDSENSYTEQSPKKCKTPYFRDTRTTAQGSSQIEDSEFSAIEDSECSVVDRKQTNSLRSQGTYQKSLDSNTTQRSSPIEEASENSYSDHSPKKINDDSQKTIRYSHNSPRRIIEQFSQVIEDFSEENFSQSTEDYSNAITNTEITEDETNRIEPSNAEIERRKRSPSKPVKSAGVTVVECDSESISVNSTNNSNRTVQYSVFNETGKFGNKTELGHSVNENPSYDVAERNVQNDDVINISSGDEDDTVSESEEDNDSTLSLIESDENSLDNSMEFSQVF
uniref:DNA repair metallo-beta-lactamase domain-containing protein n=2 Tax=Clytia hemisphaerica TaxID=252671 RepID=A0A7M5WSA3_9CNID